MLFWSQVIRDHATNMSSQRMTNARHLLIGRAFVGQKCVNLRVRAESFTYSYWVDVRIKGQNKNYEI